MSYPSYRALLESGELSRRVEALKRLCEKCALCPRGCAADRSAGETGVCGSGAGLRVASFGAHHGEENPLRGWGGSGTIFLTSCNLRCVFCQNYDISHLPTGRDHTAAQAADIMLGLQHLGCHNINWVTPTHQAPALVEALEIAARGGLRLPIVYNTGGYDSLELLRLLDGVVDIYMPDFKLWDPDACERLLRARDYPEAARAALREMHRQVGDLELDSDGLARRGLLVRHLVMPGRMNDTRHIMEFLAREISPDTYVNVMAQYHPWGESEQHPDIHRPITSREYKEALEIALESGLARLDERVPTRFW